jgi:uncharacterized protein YegL
LELLKKATNLLLVFFLALATLITSNMASVSANTEYVTVQKVVDKAQMTTVDEATVTLRVKGTPPVNVVKPNDIILIIDRSGSMTIENRISAAKNAAKEFIDLIDLSVHRVGVVDFSSDVKYFPLTNDAQAVKNYIDTLSANGGTATGDAVKKATEILANHREEAQPTIVILTDGDATLPSGNAYEYAKQSATEAKDAGIVFYSIALLGSNDNPDTSGPNLLLKEMATTAHHHHFVLGTVGLADVYRSIANEIGIASAYDLVITDTVDQNFQIVPDSYADNIPKPTVNGNTLVWEMQELKNETLELTYKIRPVDPNKTGYFYTGQTKLEYKTYTGSLRYGSAINPQIKVVYPAPVISSIEPDKGHVNGGETVTIKGEYFRPGVTVKFGNLYATNVQFISPNELIVTTPNGPQGQVKVELRNDDGQLTYSMFNYYANPVVTTITPNQGPFDGGNVVDIFGNYFLPGIKVYFGDQLATHVDYWHSGRLKVTVPKAVQTGSVDVKFENPDGTSTIVPNGYVYQEPPKSDVEITAISPKQGELKGGTLVYIDGKNFKPETKVYFGGVLATSGFTYYSDTKLRVMAPAGLVPGLVDVTVENPDGTTDTLVCGYEYLAPPPPPAPEIHSLSLTEGFISGGDLVYIKGANIDPNAKVYFGNKEVPINRYYDSTQIRILTPAYDTATTVDVIIENPDGQRAVLSQGFTYKEPAPDPAPIITSLSVNQGLVLGGELIYIDGKNFKSGAEVYFGNRKAEVLNYYSAEKMRVKVPEAENRQSGTVDIKVINPDGQEAILSAAYTYTAITPVITKLSATNGPLAGGNLVYIYGKYFDPNATVTVGGKTVNIDRYYDQTTLRIIMPAGDQAGEVDIVVTNPDGNSATAKYTYDAPPQNPAPVITKLSPNKGSKAGGILVYVFGNNFAKSGMKVIIGGVEVAPLNYYDGAIRFKLPSAPSAGFVDLKVVNPDGQESNVVQFEYTN